MPDQYTVRARVIPALLTALPVGLATLAWFPSGLSGASAVSGLVAWSGAAVLVGQLGRDAGKRKQADLFRSWGGEPAVKVLRHAGAANPEIVERTHKRLNALMGGKLPTAKEEAADPTAADNKYGACVRFLKDRTRDRKKFNLIYEENCNYGLRRNMWGLKPVGVTLALLSLAATAALPVVRGWPLTVEAGQPVLAPALIIFATLLVWVFVVTPGWVEMVANAYAERLLEASERLEAPARSR